ncbi:MAG TPA: GTPase [Phycisphaerae bacterium]|nr:GTPase [Phycisphaerae bacterium]
MNVSSDTIVALSSPPPAGDAPRAILRLSGPAAWTAAQALLPGLPPRVGFHGELALPLLHPTLPAATTLLFQGPRSFTGEDIAELHLPGSPALIAAVSDALLAVAGVRPATAGEFSARAFFNGKIDLTEAEGIAATIHATDQVERRAAASLRRGDLHKKIENLANNVANLLALVEAGIDFSDEEGVSFIDVPAIRAQLEGIHWKLGVLLAHSLRVDRILAVPTIVFIGKPNVGKSSLINALAGVDRSISSPIAGTTRDVLAVTMHTERGDIRLLDVPGEESPTDELRQKMMAAREQALLESDLIVEVWVDPEKVIVGYWALLMASPYLAVQNKIDLLPPEILATRTREYLSMPHNYVSAKAGWHIAELREHLVERVTHRRPASAEAPALNQRHRAILHRSVQDMFEAATLVAHDTGPVSHPELLASHLRHALDLLGQITGTISPDEILGRIFSTFCIGK